MNTGMRTFPCRNYVLSKGDTVMIPSWQPTPEDQTTMAEMDNDPPNYDIVRSGHEWYEYPDLHNPMSQISESLRKKFNINK